jgi:hypothetical protein
MTRMSKQGKRRMISPRKHKKPVMKTGSLTDNLSLGYKEHLNAAEGEFATKVFIPKIK